MSEEEIDRKELYTPQARRERFVRVAEKRTNRILNDLRLLGNTGNKTLYSYDEADVEKIFATIEKRITEVKTKFRSRKFKDEFKL